MNWLLNPDDWFGRRPGVCLVIVLLLILVAGAV
jgi:hypothetical protein